MKHIDKVFKDKLYNQKAQVPDGMWEKIAPALEEKSGRSLLWFWFAGIVTLAIGGLAYLMYANYQNNPSTTPLAEEISIPEEKTTISVPQAMVIEDSNNSTSNSDIKVDSPTENESKKTISKKNITKKPVQQVKTKAISQTSKSKSSPIVSKPSSSTKVEIKKDQNTNLVFEETINTDNLYGKPANLVVTKSYISENGSIIKQSNLSSDKKEPSYNVFINSEGLNAGALLRIVEPLENIPLPAFTKQVKKKIIP